MKTSSLIMLVLACALHLACGTEDDGTTMMNDGGNAVAMGGAGGDDAMGGAGGDDAMGGAGGDDAMGGAGGDNAMGGAGGDDAMGGAGGDDPVEETVTTAMIQTLFEAPCGVCHNATFPILNDLEGWANLASNQSDLLIVVPGDHQNSYLYHKVAGTHMDAPANGSGLIMPMGGFHLPLTKLLLLLHGLTDCQNNKSFERAFCRKPSHVSAVPHLFGGTLSYLRKSDQAKLISLVS